MKKEIILFTILVLFVGVMQLSTLSGVSDAAQKPKAYQYCTTWVDSSGTGIFSCFNTKGECNKFIKSHPDATKCSVGFRV